MLLFIIWFFAGCLGAHIQCADQFSFTSKKEDSFEHIHARCQSHIPDTINVSGITYDADLFLDQHEFEYLVSIRQGTTISAHDLARALSYLFAKNKFESIAVSCMPDQNGFHIHMKIESFWTFARLKIHGVMTGKDTYKQLYLMEPGERFDLEAHDHSLNKITESFRDEGYGAGVVTSCLVHNEKNKSIVVHVYLDKGKRFAIDATHLELTQEDEQVADPALTRDLYATFFKKLSRKMFSRDLLNKCASQIKTYLAQRGYLQVDIDVVEKRKPAGNKVDLTWQIHLYGKRQFVFFGNYFFSSAQLLETVMKFGRSCGMLPATILKQELEKRYYRSGFWDVAIETQEEPGRSFFVIKEGDRASIVGVQIKNNNFFEEDFLRKQCCAPLGKKAYFDHDTMQRCLESIAEYYSKAGFIESKIVGYDFIKQEDAHYCAEITVQEGNRFFFGTSSGGLCNGADAGPLPDGTSQAIPFSISRVYEHKQWLQKTLQARGYQNPIIKPDLVYTDHHTVDISWQIEHGAQQAQFSKTIVAGSYPVNNKTLLSALQYGSSDLWSQDYINQSFLRLKEFNVFDTLSLTPLQDPADPSKKMVLLKAYPDEPFEVRLRLGAEMQYVKKFQTIDGLTYKVGTTLMMKNPFERGDLARLDIDLAGSHREIVGSYKIPLVAPTPLYAQARVYSIKQDHPGFIGSNKNIYTIDQNGFLGSLNKKHHWADLSVNTGLEWMKTTISDDEASTKRMAVELARAINFEPRLLGKLVGYLFVEPTAFIDLLDNKLDPRNGSLSVFSLKAMVPLRAQFADGFFVRLLVEQSFFVPLKYAVLALRIRFGHIFNQLFSQIMPSERFYLGGPNSLRGYNTDLAPPLGAFIDDQGKELLVPRGGSSMINGNIELRARLTSTVGVALFQDLGLLSADRFADIKPHSLLAATGFGVRYFTPIGPLRFDLGFNWRKAYPTQPRAAWFLNFGHAF